MVDDSKAALPNLILEVANVHGGDFGQVTEIINWVTALDYPLLGLKFQPLKADSLAMPDYKWFPVYEELYFSENQWDELVAAAATKLDVWLDIFDAYGIAVLQRNLEKISGIKLQASVLQNHELVQALRSIGTSKLKLIINTSGFTTAETESLFQKFSHLGFQDVILQLGFQAYPTRVEDTGLQKIPVIAALFPGSQICMADHIDGGSPLALDIPVWAMLQGCTYIEKHVCTSRSRARFDHMSAIEPNEVAQLIARLKTAVSASSGPFVSSSEAEYLRSTVQVPLLNHDIREGELISPGDLKFRRSALPGLSYDHILDLQTGGAVLCRDIPRDTALTADDFRSARVGVIVACRLKSSRLKEKALEPIHGIPSIQRCLSNCLAIQGVDEVVLATSDLPDDDRLEEQVLDRSVTFWRGDAEDVIARYLGACEKYDIDIIVRVTADCPVVSSDIDALLLASHFKAGADYTCARDCAVGTSVEIYNRKALQRVIEYKGGAPHSEYMTWYMQNNDDIFKVNRVDLPPSLVRPYRLTLDYAEDLEMFHRLFETLDAQGLEPTAENIFTVMDNNPDIPRINEHIELSYKRDKELIEFLNSATRIG